ncbi:MAG: tetraacyldisaccharide 4'-kinase, partial [Elusimicrobiota bacterium]
MYNKKIIRIIQKVLSPVLIPLSVVYWTVIVLRSFFYKTGFFSVKRIPVNVISIGNITAGGAGKTTLTVELAQALASSGLKLAVVTRGYGRKKISNEEVLVISDGEKIYYEPEQSGDEAYLMAKKLHGVPVVVSPEKYNAGVYSSEKLGAKTILLDDGFQHRQLHRDADIVLIDCLDPFGAGLLLPAGFLREPLSSLKRADVIILTNCLSVESQKIIKIKEKINKIKPGTTFIEMD